MMCLTTAACKCCIGATPSVDKSEAKPCLLKVIEMNKDLSSFRNGRTVIGFLANSISLQRPT